MTIEIKSEVLNLDKLHTTKNRFSLINSEEASVVDHLNDTLIWGAMKYAKGNGFKWIPVPIMTKITGSCEDVDSLYCVDHFKQEAYLAQTGQLYLEAKIPVHKKLWTLITSSRAETEVDNRHLNQFQLFELEFQGDFEELLVNVEECVRSMLREVSETNAELLKSIGRFEEVSSWAAGKFGRISYTEAIEHLKGTEHEIEWGADLKSAHEAFLVKKFGNTPMFITHYPKAIKFFNMRVNDDNPDIVNSADLIMPYSGESAGCAEREDDYERLVERLKTSNMFRILSARGVQLSEFDDYLKLVKENNIRHSGCGIGMERITQSILGSKDIRVSTSFPIQADILY